MKKSITRIISVLLCLIIMSTFMAGCGNKNSSDTSKAATSNDSAAATTTAAEATAPAETKAPSNEKETIRYLTVRNKDHAVSKTVMEVLKRYQAEVNPNFNIEFEVIVDRPTQEQKVKTLVASGDTPEWFENDPNPYLSQVIKKDILVNIGDLFDELNVRDKFLSFPLSYESTKEGLYVMPMEASAEFFWYNKKMFADAGVTPPKTFDEFLTICKKIKDKGYTPIAVCGVNGWPMIRYFSFLPFRRTGNDFLEKAIRGDESFSSEIGLEALNFVKEVGQYFQEGFATMDYTATSNLFRGGKTAMYYIGTWEVNNMVDENLTDDMKGNIDYFILPTVDGSVTPYTDSVAHAGIGTAITKSKFTDGQKAFIKYLWENYSDAALKVGGFIPPTKIKLDDSASAFLKRAVADMEKIVTPAKIWDVLQDPVSKVLFEDELNAVAMGIISPEEFAAKADKTVKENASKYFD